MTPEPSIPSSDIDLDLLLNAYAQGFFPMAESCDTLEIGWYRAKQRGILPLEGFHRARSLIKRKRRGDLRFSTDEAFEQVIDACADREETWINPPIRKAFIALHAQGLAHSIEVWNGAQLAGGVYGLALGGAFFAESMVSPERDGSKLALAELVERLLQAGYRLLDTQFLTPHLASLGGYELPHRNYLAKLEEALAVAPQRAFEPVATSDGAVWHP